MKAWATRAQTGLKDPEERAHLHFAAQQITQFQKDPKLISAPAPVQPPDGPPIGDEEDAWLP